MAPVPPAYRKNGMWHRKREPSGFMLAASACKSLLILSSSRRIDLTSRPIEAATGRGRPIEQRTACISLLISRRVPWRARGHTGAMATAPHKSLVSNKENASACCAGDDRRRAAAHWNPYRNPRAAAACSATRRQDIKPEQARGLRSAASQTPCDPSTAAGRPPTFIVNPCKSLLIPRSRGSARNGRRIVKACRSLLIHPFRPPKPVRSGGIGSRRDGHRPPPRPRSPLTESGGRP